MATNVQFLRGQHSKLPTGADIIDGAFYLTSDSNRLYVGKGSGTNAELIELNKSITKGASVSELPTTNVEDGQFYYAIAENILCVYDGKTLSWMQMNPISPLQMEKLH